MFMSMSYRTISPTLDGDGAVKCVWCGDTVAKVTDGEGLTTTQGPPNMSPNKSEDTEEGVKIWLDCLECGATNVVLGVDQSN